MNINIKYIYINYILIYNYIKIIKETVYCMPYWLHKFTFISALYKGSLYSTSSLTLASSLFDSSHPNRFEVFFIFKSSLKRKSIGLCGSFIF